MLAFPRTMLVRLVLVLASMITGLLICEVIARLVAPIPMAAPWRDQINGVLAPQPNVRGRQFAPGLYDSTFSISAQRFRGQELYQPEPAPGVFRIAALGASFTFGTGASDSEAYPSQLQSILQKRSRQNRSNLAFEVINAGIRGTVTAEQALWYDNWVRRFHPHLVILNVACAVDMITGLFSIDKNGRVTPHSSDELRAAREEFFTVRKLTRNVPGYAFLAQHSELFNLLRITVGEVIRRRERTALANESALLQPASAADQLQKLALPLEAGEVTWLKERVEQSGAHLAVAVFPCRENIYSSQSPWAGQIRRELPTIVNVLRAVTSKESIPFTDLAPEIRERAKQSQQPLYYNSSFETHPTPAGYRAIAEAVAAFLVERGVVQTNGGSPAP